MKLLKTFESFINESRDTDLEEKQRDMVKLIKRELRLDVKQIGFEEENGDGDIEFQLHEGPVIYSSALADLIKAGKFKDASIHYYSGEVTIKLIK